MSDFQLTQAESQAGSVMEAAQTSREVAEIRSAIQIAKMFPRDENAAYTRIMKMCDRKSLAEQAQYSFPRGGTNVVGPSIRLAEAMAQAWGNIRYGVKELEQKDGSSQMEAFAWDVETNTYRSMSFKVEHKRKTKKGTYDLDDPRDIYEMNANQGARRVRACILAIIPGDVVDAAVEACEKTLKSGHSKPLSDRVRDMLVGFEKTYQVKTEWIEKYAAMKVDAFDEHTYLKMIKVANALKDGIAKREDYFGQWMNGEKTEATAAKSSVQAGFDATKANPTDEGTKGDSKPLGGAGNDPGIDESDVPK